MRSITQPTIAGISTIEGAFSLPVFLEISHAEILDELIPLVNGVQVAVPEPGDIVFSVLRGTLWHFGLYAGNGEFLHTLAPHNSCVERVDSMKWRTRIEGYYRV